MSDVSATPSIPVIIEANTDRREFIRCATCGLASLAALSLVACGGDAPTAVKKDDDGPPVVIKHDTTSTTPAGDPKFEISASQITVHVALIADLDSVPGFLLIDQAQTIILHTGPDAYLALSAVCTHEGCTVNGFTGESMVCPCHGSTYNLAGNVTVGPATLPLKEFSTTFDASTKTLVVLRAN